MIVRVVLPYHLRNLAGIDGEAEVDVPEPVTLGGTLDALENSCPALRGAIRDHRTKVRRPFLRFFACEEDISHQAPEIALPDPIARGREPLLVIGAMAGG